MWFKRLPTRPVLFNIIPVIVAIAAAAMTLINRIAGNGNAGSVIGCGLFEGEDESEGKALGDGDEVGVGPGEEVGVSEGVVDRDGSGVFVVLGDGEVVAVAVGVGDGLGCGGKEGATTEYDNKADAQSGNLIAALETSIADMRG